MYVAHLTLVDFRSYATADVLLEPGATAFVAFRTGRTLPFALAVLAGWLGLQRTIFAGAGRDAAAALLVSAASAAAALFVVLHARRRMMIS